MLFPFLNLTDILIFLNITYLCFSKWINTNNKKKGGCTVNTIFSQSSNEIIFSISAACEQEVTVWGKINLKKINLGTSDLKLC